MLDTHVIGIDLGTTNARAGLYSNGKCTYVCADYFATGDSLITPSYVAWDGASGRQLVGNAAKNQAATNPASTVYAVRRLIGRQWDDPELQSDLKLLPYSVVEKEGKPVIQVAVGAEPHRLFTPQEVTAV